MKSPNYSRLLKLADTFLTAALKIEERYWVLGSLFSLAEDESVLPPPKFPKFRGMLGYLGVVASDEDWNTWFSTNASVLGDLPYKHWAREGSPLSIFCEVISPSGNKYIQVYIRNDSQEPDKIDVTSASHLKGIGAIPQLWMFSGPYIGEQSAPLSKQVAYYDWFSQSVSNITGGQFDFDFSTNMEAFVIGHKLKLDALRKWFKYEPKLLGGGSDGTAWDIGNRRILKIFSDPVSYNHALQAVDRIHNNPSLAKTEAMIYDVGEIGKFGNHPIYFYIMERMAPVTEINGLKEDLRHIVSTIVSKIYKERDYWRDIKKKDIKKDSKLIQSKVKEAASRYANEIKTKNGPFVRGVENTYLLNKVKVDKKDPNEHDVPLNKNWLTSLAEEVIVKYLTGRTDLHMGNLGVTAYGDFRYFDPAFESWTSNVNMGGGVVPNPEADPIDWGDI